MTAVPRAAAATLLIVLMAVSTPSRGADEIADDRWELSIRPYLWLAGVSGNVAADGVGSPIDTGYSFLSLDNLEAAAFLGLGAHKGPWTIQTDLIYINFEDQPTFGPFTTNIDLTGGALELSGAYQTAAMEHMELIFGARWLSVEVGIDVMPGPQASERQTWTDPIVGLRYTRPISRRWRLLLRGDVGGFGVSSDFTFNGVAGASYDFTQRSSLSLGYRYLRFDFKDGDFIADLTVQGYAIGYQYRW